jgi:hypothetical protein
MSLDSVDEPVDPEPEPELELELDPESSGFLPQAARQRSIAMSVFFTRGSIAPGFLYNRVDPGEEP